MQQLVFDWLNKYYPRWRVDWMEGNFGAYENLPIEIRMIPAFGILEHNMINGGWSQVLWNCFGSWRQLIETVREGYVLIGDAPKHLAALDDLYALCERDEAECEGMLKAEDGSMVTFGKFTSRSYGTGGAEWETLFWPGTDIYWRRLHWLGRRESHIRSLLDASTPERNTSPDL
ncbi:MAG: hypothetical protein H6969_09700 [Gammaproteobacteria bacterium]|nr:hypothetical protein [Gammaproteobacteria bacterium]